MTSFLCYAAYLNRINGHIHTCFIANLSSDTTTKLSLFKLIVSLGLNIIRLHYKPFY